MAADEFLIPPPHTMVVDHERKPRLYLPDGRALVRQAGFRMEVPHDVPRVREAAGEVSRPRRPGQTGSAA